MAFGDHVQSTGSNLGSVPSGVLAFPANNTLGNILVVVTRVGAYAPLGVTSVADTRGNVWWRTNISASDQGGGFLWLEVWYALNCAAGPNTVTVTLEAVYPLMVIIGEYTGSGALSRVIAGEVTGGAGGDTAGFTPVETTDDTALLIAVVAVADTGNTLTPNDVENVQRVAVEAAPATGLSMADRVLSSTGTYGCLWTLDVPTPWVAGALVFGTPYISAPAISRGDTSAPGVVLGSVAPVLTPAATGSSTFGPSVTLGSLSITPTPASATGSSAYTAPAGLSGILEATILSLNPRLSIGSMNLDLQLDSLNPALALRSMNPELLLLSLNPKLSIARL